MTQTPTFAFNKNTFAWAIDIAWDFKKHLFDCIAGLREETESDRNAFQKLEGIIANSAIIQKSNIEKDAATLYLSRLVLYCHKNPNSPQTKAFVEVWKSIYLLFPNRKRPLESVAAFKCLLSVQDLFESKKAQYYIMHAFANYTNFERQADKMRALTTLALNNEHATVADLMAVLDLRSDMDEKIARAIVEKCHKKVVEMEKMPVEFRDKRSSGDKEYNTKYAYKIKNICSNGMDAVRILMNICPKYAIDKKDFFTKAMERAKTKPAEDKPEIVMPDINDLSQFPNYSRVLQSVKEAEKKR
jgi:hypothetical protein